MSALLQSLWRASWQAAVLVLLVLAIQWVLRRQLSARWRYNLWLIVLLRLALPVTPPAPWSMFNIVRPPPVLSTIPVTSSAPFVILPDATDKPVRHQHINWPLIMATIWATGAGMLALRVLIATIRLQRAVNRAQFLKDERLCRIFADARRELDVHGDVRLLRTDCVTSPALMGIFHPKLLLPPHVLTNFDPRELRLIFLHELAHLRRRDVAVNWLATTLLVIHWFNPIVWLMLHRLRADREVACDELVLSRTQPHDRASYGHTILKLLEQLSGSPGRLRSTMPAGMVGILESAAPLKRRITMIASFTAANPRRAWVILAAAITAAVGCAALTDGVRAQSRPVANTVTVKDGSITLVGNSSTTQRAVTGVNTADFTSADRTHADARLIAIRSQLERRMPKIDFQKVPVSDVIDFMRQTTGMNIVVNEKALEAAGMDLKTPITLQLRDVRVEDVFKHVARQAGGGTLHLGFSVDGDAITFSTEEDLARNVITRAYNVRDLIQAAATQPAEGSHERAMDSLKQVIENNVDADNWREAGGTISGISTFGDMMVIQTTMQNHLQIDSLLRDLRETSGRTATAPGKTGISFSVEASE